MWQARCTCALACWMMTSADTTSLQPPTAAPMQELMPPPPLPSNAHSPAASSPRCAPPAPSAPGPCASPAASEQAAASLRVPPPLRHRLVHACPVGNASEHGGVFGRSDAGEDSDEDEDRTPRPDACIEDLAVTLVQHLSNATGAGEEGGAPQVRGGMRGRGGRPPRVDKAAVRDRGMRRRWQLHGVCLATLSLIWCCHCMHTVVWCAHPPPPLPSVPQVVQVADSLLKRLIGLYPGLHWSNACLCALLGGWGLGWVMVVACMRGHGQRSSCCREVMWCVTHGSSEVRTSPTLPETENLTIRQTMRMLHAGVVAGCRFPTPAPAPTAGLAAQGGWMLDAVAERIGHYSLE